MKGQKIINIVIGVILCYFFFVIWEYRRQMEGFQEEISELQYKIECFERDVICFQNMHADHYEFEENVIPKYLEPEAAQRYKQYIDSVSF